MSKITIDGLADAINEELKLYKSDVNDKVKASVRKNMRAMVQETKAQRFKQDTGDYRKAIASKTISNTVNEVTMMWYVKSPHYRLSHLLEYGHATRNGGRTIAYGFIGKAEKTAVTNFEKDIMEALKNG